MSLALQRLVLLCCFPLMASCAIGGSDTFTFTADLPPNFTYRAIAVYVPAKGETCTVPGGRNTEVGFNRKWRTEYKPDSEIALYRTVSGCPMELGRVKLEINAIYGNDRGDFGSDNAGISIREKVEEQYKSTFNEVGESEFYGQCQWLFRTVGLNRRIVKLLDCKRFDAEGNLSRYRPAAAFTPDQLPGKTVRMKITLAEEERPSIRDTWVKVPGGWKRCMGNNFEDQYAFCYGNYKDFSTFQMVDGRQCTIYPGCTE
ncbi:hypothetical protein [Pseudomonas sp. BBP2017]|uniref:hypothetical protein n=1 Tax=Pseudomonas sp. BBP2017 TaxID=2109731 RepID=UPI000D121275|nr:hypothetical protein [Pseudomonas sp. BBP2017]PSS57667.1 hypothetical protein C6382_07155 [Pseudomonas sp. BBP2017]